jgi:Predicted integral membrane protein
MKKNKILKIIGGIVTIIVIIFIIQKLIELRINYELILQENHIVIIFIFSIIYGFHMFILCVPWKTLVTIFSKIKIPFRDFSWIINKSNLMKYIPGNVFQYVGRNELAIRYKLSHVDVAFCTMFDIALNIASVFFLSIIFYSQGIEKWFNKYGISSFYIIFIIIAVIGVAILIVFLKKKERVKNFYKKTQVFFKKQSITKIIRCIAYYMFLGIIVSLLYVLILHFIVGTAITPDNFFAIMGAYQLSWLLGFIVPGAPGGIGIREAAITLLLTGIISVNDALLAAVIYRLVNIIGDLFGILIAYLFKKIIDQRKAFNE